MNFDNMMKVFAQNEGVTESTMMGSPCLRYDGDFIAMFFDREDSLIIKVSPERVCQLIEDGMANEFNFTKKRFKEWALIPIDYQDKYESYIGDALEYAKIKKANK